MIDAKVFSEVYTILSQMEEISIKKIPTNIFNEIKNNATMKIDYIAPNIPLEKLNLQEETKEFLAVISYYYFCDENERKKYDETLNKNEQKYQEELKIKYNPDDIFRKKEITENKEKIQEKEIIIYKENYLKKFLNKIKEFFKRKN